MPKHDDDDFDFDKILKSLISLGEKLIQNDRGVSLLAVVAGIALKQIPRPLRISASFKNEPWIQDALKEKGWTENQFCTLDERAKQDVSGFAKQPICELVPELAVDLFPINNLFGVTIDPNLGKVPVSDLLIALGAFGVAGGVDAIAKLVEIIKPKLTT